MKELPYFKFFPGEWMKGDITVCSVKAQGLFINICAYYWSKGCDISLTQVQRRFNDCLTELKELLNDGIFIVEDDKLTIDFLDDQFDQFSEIRKQQSRAGKASAKIRKGNARSTPVQQTSNHKIREDKDKNKIKKKIFKPPTIIEVREYCKERKNTVNVNKWMSHYEANGWMVGKNKMKDWMAAVRTWENSDFGTDVKHPVVHDRTKTEGAPVGFGIPNPKAIPIPQTLKDKFNIK